ncbi:MAG: hypothetical protein AAF483_12805 [Planctomycetota bacterium]
MASVRNIGGRAKYCFLILLLACSASGFFQQVVAEEDSSQAKISVNLTKEGEQYRFVVSGLDVGETKPSQVFHVCLDSDEKSDKPLPMFGSYTVSKQGLVFVPRFPLDAKLKYRVHFSDSFESLYKGPDLLFSLAETNVTPSAKVSATYPSADLLPENLLKFYIHFTEPMKRGEAYENIRLYEGEQLVEDAFLELGEELWDVDQQRFTLFIHPGRIKQGVKPNQDKGPAIQNGKQYTLKVDSKWSSAKGLPMKEAFSRTFRVDKADYEQPNVQQWKVDTPKAGTKDSIVLHMSEPMDHAMLQRVIQVCNKKGEAIAGRIQLAKQESEWTFHPDLPWPKGTFRIIVAANLEDRSGNSIARPFEVKMQKRSAANPSTSVAIEFVVD